MELLRAPNRRRCYGGSRGGHRRHRPVDNPTQWLPHRSHPLFPPFLPFQRLILVPASGRNLLTTAMPLMCFETMQTSLAKRARRTRVNGRVTDQTKKRKLNVMHAHPILSRTRHATTPSGSTKKLSMNTVGGSRPLVFFRIIKGTLSTSLMAVYMLATFPNIAS